jgi:hypothetical protein
MSMPKYHQLFNPVLEAMHHLGGSAKIAEMDDETSTAVPVPQGTDADQDTLERLATRGGNRCSVGALHRDQRKRIETSSPAVAQNRYTTQ